jgi:hypothetical protein
MKQFSFVALFILLTVDMNHAQEVPGDWYAWHRWWRELPIEAQLETYMEIYKTEKILFMYHINAGDLAIRFGTRLIPFLKKYVENADYFHLRHEPKDITLTLVSLIFYNIQIYTQPGFEYINNVYPERGKEPVAAADIKWFVEQYKQKIDEYILKNRVIDTTVYFSEVFLLWLVCDDLEKLKEYDHIQYDKKYIAISYEEHYKLLKDTLKKYYEERLSISDLEIKPLEFTPVYME